VRCACRRTAQEALIIRNDGVSNTVLQFQVVHVRECIDPTPTSTYSATYYRRGPARTSHAHTDALTKQRVNRATLMRILMRAMYIAGVG
jgi:hypothetical protein